MPFHHRVLFKRTGIVLRPSAVSLALFKQHPPIHPPLSHAVGTLATWLGGEVRRGAPSLNSVRLALCS